MEIEREKNTWKIFKKLKTPSAKLQRIEKSNRRRSSTPNERHIARQKDRQKDRETDGLLGHVLDSKRETNVQTNKQFLMSIFILLDGWLLYIKWAIATLLFCVNKFTVIATTTTITNNCRNNNYNY